MRSLFLWAWRAYHRHARPARGAPTASAAHRYRFAGTVQPPAVTVPSGFGRKRRAVNETEPRMATQDTYSGRVHQPADVSAPTSTETDPTILERWRERSAERKRRRLVSARSRRVLAHRLRRTGNRSHDPDPVRRHRETRLHYRAAAVRAELLEIAALIEHAPTPDPACVAALRNLLANGCDRPLYKADIHICELHVNLHYVRSGL
jgi:hypothetical protein